MDAAQPSNFPNFDDGDVTIVISANQLYRLHSSVLRRNSPFFARELDSKTAPKLVPVARREGLTPYRFEHFKAETGGVGAFKRIDINDRGRPARSTFVLPELENGKIANEQYRHWDWLFGAFYHRQPDFDDESLATVIGGCMGLVDVAESIGSVDHVREQVDLALVRQDKILWSAIASNPAAWAELARRVHSPLIFKEAACHIIGKWQSMSESEKDDLHPEVRALCQRKFKDLDIAKEAIDMRILGHYPAFLCRNAADRPGRHSYANDVYMWMAICFFRQWYAQAISDGRNRVNPDGGYNFYTALAKGGIEYLSHEAFQNFHQFFPMSRKAANVLEANMGVMKEDIKPFVEDLVINRVHVDETSFPPLNWLTCAVIDKSDCPWTVDEEYTTIGNVDPFSFGDVLDETFTRSHSSASFARL